MERIVKEEEPKMMKKIKHYIYDPTQIMGSGFSSNVYKGVNEQTGQTIAIKVLELAKIQSQVQKYLLNNQINALRALSHPHVLRTIQILMTKNNVYIMTQFCQNGDLQQYVKTQNNLTQYEALKILRDIADGYLAIQQKLIVHRDLKTANIFLTSAGAKIADFGFCQFLNQTKKPQIFYNVGSPAYMSPQSYRDNIYSNKSDVWSMGIVLYQMLNGQTPDKSLSYAQMSSNLMSGRINCKSQQIKRILSGCFRKQTKQRFSPQQLLQNITNQLKKIEQKVGKSKFNNFSPSISENKSRTQHSNRFINEQQRFSPAKKQPKGNSPFNKSQKKQQKQDKNSQNKIKSITQILLLLFRLLNYLGEINLQSNNFMRLILFRHRSFLQISVQKIINQQRIDHASYQPYKQFNYLKSRFDQTYLVKQSQFNSSLPASILIKINQLSNVPINDPKAISVYSVLTVQCCKQCEKIIQNKFGQQRNKIGVAWDYLMIHTEILIAYHFNPSFQKISNEEFMLTAYLKDKPRNISNVHIQLLKYKLNYLKQQIQTWSQSNLE